MPVTPKLTWTQTKETLTVSVEIPGITRCKPDVFATSALLKVNALPYLLHLDLAHDVDDAETVAAITECGITFTLRKVEAGRWKPDQLTCSAALHPRSFPHRLSRCCGRT